MMIKVVSARLMIHESMHPSEFLANLCIVLREIAKVARFGPFWVKTKVTR